MNKELRTHKDCKNYKIEFYILLFVILLIISLYFGRLILQKYNEEIRKQGVEELSKYQTDNKVVVFWNGTDLYERKILDNFEEDG